jgi:acetylornithine/succinyldiaminopimelate/putrescine aminotransferase
MTLAKPLAGGLPIGAALVTEAVAQIMRPGDHGSTFAGGPLVCTAANVVFDRVAQPAFLAQVRENSAYLLAQLRAQLPAERVVDIRGRGLMIGVELTHSVRPLIPLAAAHGLVIINAGENVLRLVPPLIATPAHIDVAVARLVACLQQMVSEVG